MEISIADFLAYFSIKADFLYEITINYFKIKFHRFVNPCWYFNEQLKNAIFFVK